MKFFCSMFLFLALSGCGGDDTDPVIPEDRTFSFTVDNVEIFDGLAPTAAAVQNEKRLIEMVIKSQPIVVKP